MSISSIQTQNAATNGELNIPRLALSYPLYIVEAEEHERLVALEQRSMLAQDLDSRRNERRAVLRRGIGRLFAQSSPAPAARPGDVVRASALQRLQRFSPAEMATPGAC
jgi:hypothetical protein